MERLFPARAIVGAIGRYRRRFWRLRWFERTPAPPEPVNAQPASSVFDSADNFDDELARTKQSLSRWMELRRACIRQYTQVALPHLAALRSLAPRAAADTVVVAETFLAHRFDLLGSGPFIPVDPDRPLRGTYRPIDWYLDPVRGLRFPRGVPYKEWRLYEMRPGLADIKYPWELARCQHWMTLAQAWALTGDDRFAIEIADELNDFMESNPVGIGVNWTCTMDVAIRAGNWCLALALVLDCGALQEDFWRKAYGALFDHARFIFSNFENTYEVTSNHYLSNIVGLHFLAAEFAGLPVAMQWNDWCRNALETEIEVQVHDEGTDFESSVPYHRLVTELFMASARLARLQAAPLSAGYESKLARMIEFVVAITRPDGLMPVIGDADDGRFHIFSHFGNWNRQDARHLIAPAAAMFGRPDWLPHAGPDAVWESAWWGYEPGAPEPTVERASYSVVKLFPAIGIAVARHNGHYLAVTNGAVGTRGFGNHKHNELLSFEYHHDGVPVVVDPGSYVYTSDAAARNLFRGTSYHNTIMIDGVEQNEFNPEWLFRMFEKAQPEHLELAEINEWIEYRGRHHGYERLPDPVLHERRLRLHRRTGALVIEDRLEGRGAHELLWHFRFAPGVDARPDGAGVLRLTTKRHSLIMRADAGLDVRIEPGWYSPSYGVRVVAQAAVFCARATLDGSQEWRFTLEPAVAANGHAQSAGATA